MSSSSCCAASSSRIPSDSSASSIPEIWRNNSLKRARLVVPTIPLAEMTLGDFLVNTVGSRLTEALPEAPKLSVEVTSTCYAAEPPHISIVDNAEAVHHKGGLFEQTRPPTPYDHGVDPTELTNLPTIIESAHYPIYRGYERDEFLRTADSWIITLSTMHAQYKNELHKYCNWLQPTRLCQYKKLTRRMKRMVDSLEQLVTLLNARSKYADLPNGCADVRRDLGEWIDSATVAIENLSLRSAKKWRTAFCGGMILLEITSRIMELAFELKVGPLKQVVVIVDVLEKETDAKA